MATYTATSWAEVQGACDNATADGDIVFLDFATATPTAGVSWTAPPNATLKGRGSLSTTGGGDATVITDGINGSDPLFNITVNATGVFRFVGITIEGSASYTPLKTYGELYFAGGVLRIDHCHIDTSMAQGNPMSLLVNGVMDHCIWDVVNVGPYILNGGLGQVGNESQMANVVWSEPTNFGSDDFFFIEDCVFTGVTSQPFALGDGWTGCRLVYRFNTIQGGAGFEGHATGHAGDNRGVRAVEAYCNSLTTLPGQSGTPGSIANCCGGPMMAWGSVSEHDHGITFHVTRRNSVTYPETPTPNAWGYAGPAPIATGTVNVTGTAVTRVSGDNFDTDWPAGTMIYMAGSSCEAFAGQAPGRIASGGIASVNSTTSITLTNGGHDGAPLTGVAYAVGSAWDGNTDEVGYPCLDQPGRGQGDLLDGVFPDKINDASGIISWPNQALEPIYIWKNANSGGGCSYGNNTGGRVVENRDYYPQASGIQTNATTPFDGTVGTGWGTLANRPTTCTAGVAYWAIDQGSWNTSESNPYGVDQEGASGVLYVATATDTWTEYYEPYTYPHPLQGGSPPGFGVSGLVKLSGNCTLQ